LQRFGLRMRARCIGPTGIVMSAYRNSRDFAEVVPRVDWRAFYLFSASVALVTGAMAIAWLMFH
jgi:hypothetical protein